MPIGICLCMTTKKSNIAEMQPAAFSTVSPARPAPLDPSDEEHDSINDLAKRWRKSRGTIVKLVKDEPGVIKISLGEQGKKTTYSIPKSVSRRIHQRLGTRI